MKKKGRLEFGRTCKKKKLNLQREKEKQEEDKMNENRKRMKREIKREKKNLYEIFKREQQKNGLVSIRQNMNKEEKKKLDVQRESEEGTKRGKTKDIYTYIYI